MNTHGGARPGAGRKPADKNSVQVNWRVSDKAKAWMRDKSMTLGESTATILDLLIEVFEESITEEADLQV